MRLPVHGLGELGRVIVLLRDQHTDLLNPRLAAAIRDDCQFVRIIDTTLHGPVGRDGVKAVSSDV